MATGYVIKVVGDHFKPDTSILPAVGSSVTEPGQAAHAAYVTGCTRAIPEAVPCAGSYAKIERFPEILSKDYPHVEGVHIPIGGVVGF